MTRPSNHMANRRQAKGSFDYFPTPPWAVRALLHELLLRQFIIDRTMSARDPACGGGHMLEPLKEVFARVGWSDVHDWGIAPDIRDFTFETAAGMIADGLEVPDWIITNPPFEIAHAFLRVALSIAKQGVALLLRLGWMAGQERFNTIFGPNPPTFICPFAERVGMIEGAWDPEAKSATDYAWFVWVKPAPEFQWGSQLRHFPPGMQDRYTRTVDMALAMPGESKRRAEERKKRELENAGVG